MQNEAQRPDLMFSEETIKVMKEHRETVKSRLKEKNLDNQRILSCGWVDESTIYETIYPPKTGLSAREYFSNIERALDFACEHRFLSDESCEMLKRYRAPYPELYRKDR